ncbi:MAG TPA: L-seryl-tRNA(Sec) selenium transferase [Desulfatiglandales bacterium]|nr:L-seryl-tRNA(Sec) selenium transferase [Desulfatiglandales bacterium]
MPAKDDKHLIFRRIPSVDQLLEASEVKGLMPTVPRTLIVRAIREVLGELRETIKKTGANGERPDVSSNAVIGQVTEKVLKLMQPSLRQVINATGIIVHTNLGRSLLAKEVIAKLAVLAGCYTNLEYDLNAGKRGSRYVHVEDILKELTGAESALVVNNNAAAVLLALDTLAKGKEVVISRSQLVEIGGSFRMPEVMRKSGAKMFEVGSTNKTTVGDYEAAIVPDTALLLKVHKSNFEIVGFTQEVGLEELVDLGRKYGIPVMEDLGSGCLIDFSRYGFKQEPTVQDSIEKGVDIVTFSGDKMLGGPQCGIILGKKDIISALKANQLARALRVDKLTLIALQETLLLYRDEEGATKLIPTLDMICRSYRSVCKKAQKLFGLIGKINPTNFATSLTDGFSQVGGGALPLEGIKSRLLCLSPNRLSASRIVDILRSYDPPIIARLEKNHVLLDIRTIGDQELEIVARAIQKTSTEGLELLV